MRLQLLQQVLQAMGLMVVIMEELMMMDSTVRAITVDIMTMVNIAGNITTMGSTVQDFMVDITTMDNTAKAIMEAIMLELMLGLMLQPTVL
jgi:hypothetical protein